MSNVIFSSFYMPEREFSSEQIQYIRDNSALMPELENEMTKKIDRAVDLLYFTRQEWENNNY